MNTTMTNESMALPGDEQVTAGGDGVRKRVLSKAAVTAAFWAPLFFVVAVMSMMVMPVPQGADPGVAWWQYLLRFTVLPAGLAAPLGVTALGWWSVGAIRRSEGCLYGMRLAVFDGLLFPLLLVDALIFGCVWWVSGFVVAAAGGDVPGATGVAGFLAETRVIGVLLVTLVLSLVVNVCVYLAVWRRVRVS